MSNLLRILHEVISNFSITRRIAMFNLKAQWAENYLGSLWMYLEPLIYMGTYFIVFGLGLYNNNIGGYPYLVWLLAGMVPWYYLMGAYNSGITSISSQITLLTKMKFPLSVAPVMAMISEFRRYIVMTVLYLVILVFMFHMQPSIYWIQWIYAFIVLIATIFAHNLINSTLAVVLPDYKRAASAAFRILMFTSGVFVNLDAQGLPFVISQFAKLFPFYYTLETFRNTFVYHEWFWEQPSYAVFFWMLTFLMLLLGAHLHMRFREKFVDLL